MRLSELIEKMERDAAVDPEQKYRAAQDARSLHEAKRYLKACAQHLRRQKPNLGLSQAAAELREKMKIAYLAGEMSAIGRARIEAMYEAQHPFAGPAGAGDEHRKTQLPIGFAELCQAWDNAKGTEPVMGRGGQACACGHDRRQSLA
jgi:hypothetical protein